MFSDSLYLFCKLVVWLFLKVWARFEVENVEKLPKGMGVILAPNHASYIDIPCIGVAASRRVYFIARDDLFNHWLLNGFMRVFATIPIARRQADLAALKAILGQLKKKRVVCLFPEGTRSPDGKISEAVGVGIGFLAIKGQVPVLPVYIAGSYKVLPKGSRGIRSHPVKIIFGDPIYPETIAVEAPTKERYRLLTERVMQALKDLQEKTPPKADPPLAESGSSARNTLRRKFKK
jgi:1-acyl-sn-glycerol-3-phosphate acyltransferase